MEEEGRNRGIGIQKIDTHIEGVLCAEEAGCPIWIDDISGQIFILYFLGKKFSFHY